MRPLLTRLRAIHPGIALAALDALGLAVAGYLSWVELRGELPACGGPFSGCAQVAMSEYSRIGDIPVAVFGVALSLTLLALALAWTRRGGNRLLLAHYGLSLVGVAFEIRFTYLQVAVIGAVCIYCATYGLSLLARFLIALRIWTTRDRREGGAWA